MIFNTHLIRQLTLKLCGVFLFILMIEWLIINVGGSESSPLSPLPNFSQETEQLLLEFPALQVEDYAALAEAPLFVEGRNPIVSDGNNVAEGVEKQSSHASLHMRLMGVTLSVDGSLALVVDSKGTYHRLFVDDEALGWTLTSVEQQSATFNRGGKIITLTLEKHKIGKLKKAYRSRQLRSAKPLSPAILKNNN